VAGDDGELLGIDVGGYVVERELGRGGMGVVYAATHPMIGKRAAIKVLKSELSSNPATVERFIQEARSVNKIGHPNIVDIFAFGTLPDGRSYLVMDHLEGEPLRKRVKRAAIPPAECGLIIDEIASGLEAAHAAGFIHRDLKPDNVFLVANPTRFELKLLDFGLAKLLPGMDGARAYTTVTGAQIGTPDYMSPEQLRGTGVDHRTDIYALGILAFEILARQRPHRFATGEFDLDGKTFKEALSAVPGVPAELAELIDAMVARNAGERPTLQAIRAVLKRLRPVLGAMPSVSDVRPVASEISLGAFGMSALGAKPVLPTAPNIVVPAPPTAPTMPIAPAPPTAPTMPIAPAPPTAETKQIAAPPSYPHANGRPPIEPSPVWSMDSMPVHPSAPVPAAPMSGLRSQGTPVAATKLGVGPSKAPTQPRPSPAVSREVPVGTGESKLWLLLGALLVVGATIVLIIVLMG